MNAPMDAFETYRRYVNMIAALTTGVAAMRLTIGSLRIGVASIDDSKEEERAREEIHEALPLIRRAVALLDSAQKRIVQNRAETGGGA